MKKRNLTLVILSTVLSALLVSGGYAQPYSEVYVFGESFVDMGNAQDLFWSYHFLSGALTLTFAETGRIDNLSGGIAKSSDMASINERMPKFLAAGFERLCKKT